MSTKHQQRPTPNGIKKGKKEAVDHPAHYNAGKIEVIEAIHAWGLVFNAGNIVKYVARAKHKGGIQDLKKAQWYLNDFIVRLERGEVSL